MLRHFLVGPLPAVFAACLLAAGCDASASPCVPGETHACLGDGRCPGVQVCAADGTHFGACSCGELGPDGSTGPSDGGFEGDGGMPSDASVPPADAGRDASVPSLDSFTGFTMPDTPPFEVGPRDVRAASCDGMTLTSANAIRDALSGASDGDCFWVADGTYDLGSVTIGANDVTLAAENIPGVTFNGDTHIDIDGNGILLEGMRFHEGSDRDDEEGIEITGDGTHLSRLTFESWGATTPDNVTLSIRFNPEAGGTEVSDSRFTDQYGFTMLQPQEISGDFVSSRAMHIHHNEWIDNPRRSFGNGGETIQIGTAWAYGQAMPGGTEDYDDGTEMLFEHNAIIRHSQEGEIVSLKSSRNILQYNHFDDCDGAIVVRMGLNNLIYGNWMTDVDQRPIRISGERNVIAFNYFHAEDLDGTAWVALHSEDRRESSHPWLVNHYWAAVDNLYTRNILEGFEHIAEGSRQRFEIHTWPNGNAIRDNYMVGAPTLWTDADNDQTAEEFEATNTVAPNHGFSRDGARWESASPVESNPYAPVSVEGYGLSFEGTELPPPSWWRDLGFE